GTPRVWASLAFQCSRGDLTPGDPAPPHFRSVVIEDRPPPAALRDPGVGRLAEAYEERFVPLLHRVADDGNGDRLRRLPGDEGEHAGSPHVVAAGPRRSVLGHIVDGSGPPGGAGARHHEGGAGGAAISLGD